MSGEGTDATQFKGVSLVGVRAGGTGLYELTTMSGVPVRPHDMSLVEILHVPARRELVMKFCYDDPEWTPEEARETPLAIFAFDGVEILERQDEPAEPGTKQDVLGQVRGFDYHEPTGIFALSAYTMYWVFTARSLTLTLQAADEG